MKEENILDRTKCSTICAICFHGIKPWPLPRAQSALLHPVRQEAQHRHHLAERIGTKFSRRSRLDGDGLPPGRPAPKPSAPLTARGRAISKVRTRKRKDKLSPRDL